MKAKIEFRPTRYSGKGWAYEINYIVKDLIEFLEFCEVDERSILSVKELMNRKRRSKKPYSIYRPTKVEIYPHENRVSKLEVGIHYICQHGFDILPVSVRTGIHNTHFEDETRFLGTLYPEPNMKVLYPDLQESYSVTTTDISRGFMLDSNEIKEYSDSFSIWIIERRKKFPSPSLTETKT